MRMSVMEFQRSAISARVRPARTQLPHRGFNKFGSRGYRAAGHGWKGYGSIRQTRQPGAELPARISRGKEADPTAVAAPMHGSTQIAIERSKGRTIRSGEEFSPHRLRTGTSGIS